MPVLSAAWFMTMVVTLEERMAQFSEEVDSGLKKIKKDIFEIKQFPVEVYLCLICSINIQVML